MSNGQVPEMRKGSVVIAGTGIQLIGHMTHEARISIRRADKVLHVVTDYPNQAYLSRLNPNSESLSYLYEEGKPRDETYRQMVEAIMKEVRSGLDVCAVFYGHPGVFVRPSHEVIRVARSEGYEAVMLPGISAEDCLFADLGVDPADSGCQSFEATDFLVHRRGFDPTSSMILWQIGVIGVRDTRSQLDPSYGLGLLAEVLKASYGGDHEVVVYEASSFPFPLSKPLIQRTTLDELDKAKAAPLSTLYVPPLPPRLDPEMIRRLGLDPDGRP